MKPNTASASFSSLYTSVSSTSVVVRPQRLPSLPSRSLDNTGLGQPVRPESRTAEVALHGEPAVVSGSLPEFSISTENRRTQLAPVRRRVNTEILRAIPDLPVVVPGGINGSSDMLFTLSFDSGANGASRLGSSTEISEIARSAQFFSGSGGRPSSLSFTQLLGARVSESSDDIPNIVAHDGSVTKAPDLNATFAGLASAIPPVRGSIGDQSSSLSRCGSSPSPIAQSEPLKVGARSYAYTLPARMVPDTPVNSPSAERTCSLAAQAKRFSLPKLQLPSAMSSVVPAPAGGSSSLSLSRELRTFPDLQQATSSSSSFGSTSLDTGSATSPLNVRRQLQPLRGIRERYSETPADASVTMVKVDSIGLDLSQGLVPTESRPVTPSEIDDTADRARPGVS